MTLSSSALAYTPEYAALDAALADPGRGVRIPFPDYKSAAHNRHRLNKAREIHRRQNAENFEPGEPMHGLSPYDTLILKLKKTEDGRWFVYIEKNEFLGARFESIDDEPVVEELPPTKAPQLESVPKVPLLEFKRRF